MAFQGVVGFVGLDDLSLHLAASLLRCRYKVQAFETYEPLMCEFLKLGGTRCGSPKEAGKDVSALILLTSQADQINDATSGLQKDTVLIVNSTMLPSYIKNLQTADYKPAYVVDVYATKAVSDILHGKIMIAASGSSAAILKARPVLSAMCEKLYVFEGEVGAESKIQIVKELLEGIHLVASLEAKSWYQSWYSSVDNL